jgi:hypothetical protein
MVMRGNAHGIFRAALVGLGLVVSWTGCNALLDNGYPVGGSSTDAASDAAQGADSASDAGGLGDAADLGDATSMCDADFSRSAANCGGCGHDCRPGTCLNFQCQPYLLAATEAPNYVGVGASAVWFSTATGIGALGSNGSDAGFLALNSDSGRFPFDFDSTGSPIVASAGSDAMGNGVISLLKCTPGTACVLEGKGGGPHDPTTVAVDPTASYAYVGARTGPNTNLGIKGLPLDGGGGPTFYANDFIFRLQVYGTSIFWVNGTSLKRKDVNALSSPEIPVIPGGGPLGSGLDTFFIRKQTIAYVKRVGSSIRKVLTCTLPGCVPVDAGLPPEAVVPILAMAMDDTSIYWAEDHSLRKCDLNACSATSEVTLFTDLAGSIADFAIDAQTIYIADTGSGDAGAGIYAVAK